ncbi:MAG: AAA family ATPase [Candidatus Asgardarchaeia archaeon]
MFIKSMTIRNFRGIKECSIDEFADVNVLIGRNGSGKSTILESIYLSSAWTNPHDVLRDQKRLILLYRGGLVEGIGLALEIYCGS